MNRRYRKTVIAGNWKMNMTASDTKKFADDIKAIMPAPSGATWWCASLREYFPLPAVQITPEHCRRAQAYFSTSPMRFFSPAP